MMERHLSELEKYDVRVSSDLGTITVVLSNGVHRARVPFVLFSLFTAFWTVRVVAVHGLSPGMLLLLVMGAICFGGVGYFLSPWGRWLGGVQLRLTERALHMSRQVIPWEEIQEISVLVQGQRCYIEVTTDLTRFRQIIAAPEETCQVLVHLLREHTDRRHSALVDQTDTEVPPRPSRRCSRRQPADSDSMDLLLQPSRYGAS